MESSNGELPSDVIFEVLSRTSLRTLAASRLVCKEWNRLSYDSKFQQLHSKNTNTISGFLIQSEHDSKKWEFVLVDGKSSTDHLSLAERARISGTFPLSLNKLHGIKIEASSDQGLFVFVRAADSIYPRYCVSKPSTKQGVALPNPKMRHRSLKVALVVLGSNPWRYKIIRISEFKNGSWRLCIERRMRYRCEIFDSTIWAWKESYDILLPEVEWFVSWSPVVHASGSLHYLTNQDRVLAFDYNTESYHLFELPKHVLYPDNYGIKLLKYQGKLGFSCRRPNGSLELWVKKSNYGWERKLVLTTEILKGTAIAGQYPSLGGFVNSDVAFLNGIYSRSIFYNVKNGNAHEVKVGDQLSFAFQSDHEKIDLEAGRRCNGIQ